MTRLPKAGWVLLAGLLIAGAAYWGTYRAGTAACHTLERSNTPELAWLKEQFHLGDAEYGRIVQMHETYLSGCAQRCRLIDAKNLQLKQLLVATNAMTLEITRALDEAAQMKAECQKQMLAHFYAVSQMMPPDQGRQYLAWVQAKTVLTDSHQGMSSGTEAHGGMHGH